MAASRSVLEALLARVQKRASEPRTVLAPAPLERSEADAAEAAVDTLPPDAEDDVFEDDIEEYDEELIEIIDDAEVIPQAAAAARAIEPGAFGAALDRRPSAFAGGKSAPALAAVPAAHAPAKPVAAPAAPTGSFGGARPGAARPAAPVLDLLRPESVSQRSITATEVAIVRGVRRELRSTAFVELLDASLELGS